MKPIIYKLGMMVAMLLSVLQASAYDFEVDGIYYENLGTSSTGIHLAKVTYLYDDVNNSEAYTGDIVIPNNVTYNGVSYSVVSIDEDAFYKCTGLTSIVIPNSVTSIPYGAFAGCTSLTNIEIPNSVTSIGDRAFYGCKSLTSIEIPNSVTNIGSYTFHECYSLTNIEIPNSVKYIRDYAFYGCNGLTSIEFSNSLISIGDGAFGCCRNLTSIDIPNSVTTIGDSAFYACESLTSVEIPNSMTSIERQTFAKCTSLTSVEIPNSVTSIGQSAFSGCTSLTSIEIPNSVTSIGDYAFSGCTSLTSVEIPNSVTSIGDYAFYGCNGLTSVEIPNSVTEILSYTFSGCTSLTSIEIPNSVTSIWSYAFSGCTSLTDIKIPNSVTSIGGYAFQSCASLTKIEIPNSVTYIGQYAFRNCTNLDVVRCFAVTPPRLGSTPFGTVINTLYVPKVSVDDYMSSDWAQYFSNILFIGFTLDIEGDGKVFDTNLDVVDNEMQLDVEGLKLLIVPDAGYEIASISLDGEDVSNYLNEYNVWCYEGDKEYGTLSIVFAPIGEASLTVKGAESHAITHYYKEGDETRVDLAPEYGWMLYSLTFNGEDVTSDVANSTYTTPALSGENTLEVVMIKDRSDNIDTVTRAERTLSFSRNGSEVTVNGLDEYETIWVYGIDGTLEYTGINHTVTLVPGNVYLLRTESETLKFSL